MLINSPVSGHPPYFFFLVSAYGNNSRRRTALLTDTFFNSRGCPRKRELTVYCLCHSSVVSLANKTTFSESSMVPSNLQSGA